MIGFEMVSLMTRQIGVGWLLTSWAFFSFAWALTSFFSALACALSALASFLTPFLSSFSAE